MQKIGFDVEHPYGKGAVKYSIEIPDDATEATHRLAGNILALKLTIETLVLVLPEQHQKTFRETIKIASNKIIKADKETMRFDKQFLTGIQELLDFFSQAED